METDYSYSSTSHSKSLQKYYRFHSRLYDATRWSFLFGRNDILDMIPPLPQHPRILEIGCGTGKNLRQLQNYFPNAQITGIDLSADMLRIAQDKFDQSEQITLLNAEYQSSSFQKKFDLALCSYSLTMMGNNFKNIIAHIFEDLHPGGYIAVVDFHTSPFNWFCQWMNMNHVNFSGTLLPSLHKNFDLTKSQTKRAYLGLWSYFLFVGQR